MAPEAQVWFAEGLALHVASIELAERSDPESDSLLIKATDRLRAALGDNDPLLVPALSRLAQSHERGGRAADAEPRRTAGSTSWWRTRTRRRGTSCRRFLRGWTARPRKRSLARAVPGLGILGEVERAAERVGGRVAC